MFIQRVGKKQEQKMSNPTDETKVDIALAEARPRHSSLARIGASLFYAASSFFIVMFNKSLLTGYQFPSIQILGIGQMAFTVFLLYFAKLLGFISFPDFSRDIPRRIWPLPVIYLLNLLFGLGSTQKISLPMFTVLRRFTVLFTMLGQYLLLGQKPSMRIQLTVFAMLLGAIIAAINDLAFDLVGYMFILSNDIFTASYGVYMKKKMNAKDLGKYGILFYNSAFMLVPASLVALYLGEFESAMNYDRWDQPGFQVLFFLVCTMGFVLMYSTVLCMALTSPLTANIVGTLKNLLVTYVGMVFGGDYIFSWANFIGVNVSVAGSLFYTYLIFIQQGSARATDSKSNPSKS